MLSPQRINYGRCKCGAPVTYQSSDYCSLKCEEAAYAKREPIAPPDEDPLFRIIPQRPIESVLSLDTETARSRPGLQANQLVCVSWASHETYGLLHQKEAYRFVRAALESELLLIGHQISFDMVIFAAMWPDLLPLIFQAYWDNRVTDTLLREKLIDIALGTRQFGESGFQKYALDAVASRRLGLHLKKGADTWRLRYEKLLPFPIEQWPEEAKKYAIGDAVVPVALYKDQEKQRHWLHDEYRQARAGFWIELMSTWGLHTDLQAVNAFAKKTQSKYDELARELVSVGLLRVERKAGSFQVTRNVKKVRARVEQAYAKLGKEPDRTPTNQPKTDADVCERSQDPILQKYADLSSLSTTLSTYIPLLKQGVSVPIHAYFDTLLVTGRTSSSPNVQNLPTDVGVRECFVPRPGWVFAIGDYSGMELRTWSQVCLDLEFGSEMARYLNSGLDPHIKMASLILKISYEEAAAEMEKEPTGRVYKARQSGKVANFGYPGGLGYARFVDYARTSYGVILDPDPQKALQKAKELKEFWMTAWPESQKYADWIAKQCEEHEEGAVIEQDFVKRSRGGLGFTDASNTLFQGLAADAAKHAGFLISRACYIDRTSPLFGGRIANFVHDEFIVEVPENARAHDAAVELGRLMEAGANPFLPKVPPKVEPYLARRMSKKAKPVRDSNGRLIPWDMKIAA